MHITFPAAAAAQLNGFWSGEGGGRRTPDLFALGKKIRGSFPADDLGRSALWPALVILQIWGSVVLAPAVDISEASCPLQGD